jgi:hypothetical protein
MEHIILHGWNVNEEREENLKISPEETPPKPRGSLTNGGNTHKKYHCTECPYVTDSKGQVCNIHNSFLIIRKTFK